MDRDREGDGWVPGLYMLLELAVGGDLFDKIGGCVPARRNEYVLTADSTGRRSARGFGEVLLLSDGRRNCELFPSIEVGREAEQRETGIRPFKGDRTPRPQAREPTTGGER